MKLPEKIKGRNRIRDAEICLLYEEWHESDLPKTEELNDIFNRIGAKYSLTEGRIRQILRANHSYIPIDRDWEKKKRINTIRREVARAGHSKKDLMDILEQLRKEIEGEKPLIDQSEHTHITYVWKNSGNSDSLRAAGLSSRDSLSSGEVPSR